MTRPRYARTIKSHLWYTNNYHLHLWAGRAYGDGRGRGITLKRRVHRDLWRHYAISVKTYQSRERGTGTVRHFEIERHESKAAVHERVPLSKRYVRLKICL